MHAHAPKADRSSPPMKRVDWRQPPCILLQRKLKLTPSVGTMIDHSDFPVFFLCFLCRILVVVTFVAARRLWSVFLLKLISNFKLMGLIYTFYTRINWSIVNGSFLLWLNNFVLATYASIYWFVLLNHFCPSDLIIILKSESDFKMII